MEHARVNRASIHARRHTGTRSNTSACTRKASGYTNGGRVITTTIPLSPTPAPASGAPKWNYGYDHQESMLEPIGASTMARGTQVASMSVDRSNSAETHIGTIHVHTAATDAAGIAKDLRGQLRSTTTWRSPTTGWSDVGQRWHRHGE